MNWARRHELLVILVVSALLRTGLWWTWRHEPIHPGDEVHYHELAQNLVEGRLFWLEGQPCSMRPPLYPLFVAGIYLLFGVGSFQAVRAAQAILGLATAAMAFLLGRTVYNRHVGLWTAGLVAFYPPLLGISGFLYTEILFAFWVVCLAVAILWALRGRTVWPWAIVGAGLGLAALTRSILWLFPLVLVLLVLGLWREVSWTRRWAGVCLLVASFAAVIAPWSWRCSRLEKTFVAIDVMGGRNLMMGNYEYTPMDRAWDAISVEGEQAWYRVLSRKHPEFATLSQGQRDQLALRYGLRYMLEHPGQTLQRSLVKFFNFWQLDRTMVAALERGWFGGLSRAAVLALTVLICGSYAAAMLAAVAGVVLFPPEDWRAMVVLLVMVGFVCTVHTVVFAHSRYHLPLAPLELVFAGAVLSRCTRSPKAPTESPQDQAESQTQGEGEMAASKASGRPTRWRYGLLLLCWGVLVVGWAWEILMVDWPKLQKMLGW